MFKCISKVLSFTLFSISQLSVAGVLPNNLLSLPATGCTFYTPRMAAQSFGMCANYSAAVGRNGCTIYHWPGITYPGVDVQMWLPDYFVEVNSFLVSHRVKILGTKAFLHIPVKHP